MADDSIEEYDDYGDDDPVDPDPPDGNPPVTSTLEERKRIHSIMNLYDLSSGDGRANYHVFNNGRMFDLGMCRNTDVYQIVGLWAYSQLQEKNTGPVKKPIHAFKNGLLKYVFTIKDVIPSEEGILRITYSQVTIHAGFVHEALLEDGDSEFRFAMTKPESEGDL